MTLSLDPASSEPSGHPKAVELGPDATPPVQRRTLSRSMLLGLLPAALILVIALLGPFFVPYSTRDVVALPDIAPGAAHWFGTDSAGLDVFSRTVAAARNNLMIGLLTTVAATGIGIILGLTIGMNESRRGPVGLLARAFSRALDLVQAVPAIVIGLVLIAFFGSSVLSITVALTVVLLPNQARLVRTEVLRVRGEAFLDAARISGEREWALIIRHVLPNSSWPALENASLVFGSAIVLTAGLGFLGVGLQPPTPEWGTMISTGASSAAAGRWWSALFPAVAIAVTVFAVSTVGRQLFDREN